MKYLCIALVFAQTTLAATMGLIVTINQKFFNEKAAEEFLATDPTFLAEQLEPLSHAGVFGEAINNLISELKTMTSLDSDSLIKAWDDARATWIRDHVNSDIYANLYIIKGKQLHDNAYMAELFSTALAHNDIVDYVSFVHQGDQLIKDAWNVPKTSNKFRMIYSEACQGGNGKDHFVNNYGALVSAGHNAYTKLPSPGPLFSFTFLDAWFKNKAFENALIISWQTGSLLLDNPGVFMFAILIGNYNNKEEALLGSRFSYAWNNAIEPNSLSVQSEQKIKKSEEFSDAIIY